MFEVKFKISHDGCWKQTLHKKFRSRFVSHITFSLDKHLTSDIVHVSGKNNNEFKKIISYLKRNRQIKKLDFLYEDNKNLYFQIYTDVSKTNSIVGTVIMFGGYLSKPVVVENEWEIWTIILSSKEKLQKLLKSLEKCGTLKLLHISKAKMGNSYLSNGQMTAINLALILGYYEWPRRISAQELAKKLKKSKPTLLQHLRIAESKIIKNNYLP